MTENIPAAAIEAAARALHGERCAWCAAGEPCEDNGEPSDIDRADAETAIAAALPSIRATPVEAAGPTLGRRRGRKG